jgi:hypothetical protein
MKYFSELIMMGPFNKLFDVDKQNMCVYPFGCSIQTNELTKSYFIINMIGAVKHENTTYFHTNSQVFATFDVSEDELYQHEYTQNFLNFLR